ncbi:MAG TPA: type II secretion system F family protein [Isosphaeraceae bacterium]|jgi:tight adherence protein C|nr:type II secretion system F family protein [Isosphaeraceae bacterium]
MFKIWEILVPLGSFLAMALSVWGGLTILAERRASAADRLDRLIKGSLARGEATTLFRQQDRIQALVAKAAPALSRPLQSSDQVEVGKLRVKLMNAGVRGEMAVQVYLGIKFLSLIVGLAIAVPLVYAKYGLTRTGMSNMVLGGAIGFYLPAIVLGYLKMKRTEGIFLGLPDALDLMVVCVEAGLGLDAAMRRVTTELAASWPVLCEEFAIGNFQLQMGRGRKDVLRELGIRTGVNDMRSLAAVLIQAEKFGSSIATALRVQSDSMRTRRRQLAEERAAKTAVQLIFPLVLFIFPGIFVVLVGPAAIQISESMFK